MIKDRFLVKAKTNHGVWIIGTPHYDEPHYCVRQINCDTLIPIIPQTLSQSTGIKTKEGNLVFENDVIQLFQDKYIVTRDEKLAGFCLQGIKNGDRTGIFINIQHCRIIGNKYNKENSEREIMSKIMRGK